MLLRLRAAAAGASQGAFATLRGSCASASARVTVSGLCGGGVRRVSGVSARGGGGLRSARVTSATGRAVLRGVRGGRVVAGQLHGARVSPPLRSLHTRVSSMARSSAASESVTSQLTSAQSGKPLFDKLLVANRGEIACRVLISAKRLGIKTVAIYSEPDANAKHVRLADEAVCVGPAASSDSYLRMERILEVCKETGAQAVHPGYGFLSENTEFCTLLEEHGITFIGPKQYAIHAMGLKIESKLLAEKAGVSLIPGHIGEVADADEAVEVARKIGYPVMVKASAGGGGKGMRIAYNDDQAREGYRLSKSEAKKSFGDDTIFIEKFIENPRHVEIQVLLDAHGNGVYLNERECSIQRRNQKVLEEAPSPVLDEATRKAMGEQALQMARAVDYQSAGTVEFLVDKDLNFYFLEMNTRLQVEHPVTEYITGVDLVEQMIRIAAGEELSIKQEDIGINGWALEARVYAEDPLRGFLPSIGTLTRYNEPLKQNEWPFDVRPGFSSDVRCDSGVLQGSEISMYYDPLICKLVVHGKDRDDALAKGRRALDEYVIRGVNHNVPFLRAVLDHPHFVEGNFSTKFIEEEYPNGFEGIKLDRTQLKALLGSAVAMHAAELRREVRTSGRLESTDEVGDISARMQELVINVGEQRYNVRLSDSDAALLLFDDTFVELQLEVSGGELGDEPESMVVNTTYHSGEPVAETEVDGVDYTLQMFEKKPFEYTLQHLGSLFHLTVRTPREEELHNHMPLKEIIDLRRMVISPMPGAVASVNVKPGDKVVVGQEVCVIEAMKMQNVIRAERDAVVKDVRVVAGDTVATDAVLVEYE